MAIIQKTFSDLVDFTRGSEATGWVNGQWREFGINEPRFVTDPVTGYSGLLLEPQSTNLYLQDNLPGVTAEMPEGGVEVTSSDSPMIGRESVRIALTSGAEYISVRINPPANNNYRTIHIRPGPGVSLLRCNMSTNPLSTSYIEYDFDAGSVDIGPGSISFSNFPLLQSLSGGWFRIGLPSRQGGYYSHLHAAGRNGHLVDGDFIDIWGLQETTFNYPADYS